MTTPIRTEANSLRLRSATIDDAAVLLAWRNDPSAYRHYRTAAPVASDEHLAWLAATCANPDRALFLVERDGTESVGQVRLDRHDDTVEVTMAIAGSYRGRGYGRAALTLALAACVERFPASRTITAEIAEDNAASQALFASAGFRHGGRHGRFLMLVRPIVQ